METSIFKELGIETQPQIVSKTKTGTEIISIPSTSKEMQYNASDISWINDQIKIIQTEVDSCVANIMAALNSLQSLNTVSYCQQH